jgi:hypothetical protein
MSSQHRAKQTNIGAITMAINKNKLNVNKMKMILKDLDNQLKSILSDYHYDSEVEHISKDALCSFENLRTDLLSYKHILNK